MLKIPKQFYSASPGSFGKIQWRGKDKVSTVQWTGCREEFYNDWPRLSHFLFCVPYEGGETKEKIRKIEKRTIRFMDRIQDNLGLKRIKINFTSDVGILHIKVPKFWKDRVSRSLLTALLRAGQYYGRHRTYKSAMRKVDYLKDTMYAVDRFLSGHTRYRAKYFHGWYDTFSEMKEKEIDRVLVRP